MNNVYKGKERRKFMRINYSALLAYKVCKGKTVSNLLKGYTADVSQAGLLCSIKEKVSKGDVLWLSFDRATLSMCEEIERQSLIYQNGIVGKVVRIESKGNKTFAVGIQFITRKEKNLSHIYPKTYFMNPVRNTNLK